MKNFTYEEIIRAIKNRLDDPNCMGKNRTGKVWAYDFHSLFRNDNNMNSALNLKGSSKMNEEEEFQKLGFKKFAEKYSGIQASIIQQQLIK